jgi:DNA polymerase-3 subunit epsilon
MSIEGAGMSARLADLSVLVLDCQATGPNPKKGHLLEIGWLSMQARKAADITSLQPHSHLVSLPDGIKIPKQVSRVTGICEEDLPQAASPSVVWSQLVMEADRISTQENDATCPTVIHFARYEKPFLRHLHDQVSDDARFPLNIICSWEIVRRLLPQLPRRGLRAVSGYFGHSVPEKRRSAQHVTATAIIWRACIQTLEEKHGIQDLNELRDWLVRFEISKVRRKYPMDPSVRLAVPDCPGLYKMLRSNGDVLYVGKSASLRRRVNSYFQKQTKHAEHILEMLTQARSIDISTTESALEAALTESDEIKHLSPPYNVALRERDRTIGFWTADLRQFDSKPSSSHRFGPVPSFEAFQIISDLCRVEPSSKETNLHGRFTSGLLSFPEDRGPDVATLTSGIEEFRLKHGRYFKTTPTIARSIVSLGFELWKVRQMERAQEEEETIAKTEAEPTQGDTEESKEWDPKRVVSLFESHVSRAAHLLRRARWFSLLSECSLAWNMVSPSSGNKHLIIIRSGKFADRDTLDRDQSPPVPPGFRKPIVERQACFDLAAYDRLSILTTELKRLSGSGRRIELRLGKRSVLTESELERVLSWL